MLRATQSIAASPASGRAGRASARALIPCWLPYNDAMRYLVTARVKPGQDGRLAQAIDAGTLGAGSVAGDEYLRNMSAARQYDDGRVQWVEVCFCPTPLAEERVYWEEYFDLEKIRDAHARSRCRDLTGEEPWACSNCDCSARLEVRIASRGRPFVDGLRTKA